jgi:hypothetical protein
MEACVLTADEYDALSDDPEAALLQFLDIAVARAKREQWEAEQEERGDSYVPWASLAAALAGILDDIGRQHDIRLEPPLSGNGGWEDWRTGLRTDIEKLHAQLSFKLRRGRGATGDLAAVNLSDDFRDRIRQHTRKIRGILNQIELSDNLRHLLLSRLNAFEQDLDRRRTRYEALFSFWLDATAASGDGAENLKPVIDQAERIAGLMRQCSTTPAISADTKKALTGPPNQDLDDAIPF